MLGKLIKYEFKATYKFMLLIYGLLMAMSVIISAGIALNFEDAVESISEKLVLAGPVLNVFTISMIVLFVVISVVVMSGMFFYAIKRFKDNLLGDEGYLMHTLPVKTGDNIIAKCVVSVVWTTISSFAVAIAYFIVLLGIAGTEVITTVSGIFTIFFENDIDVAGMLIILVEFVILSVVAMISSYLHIYASMAVGYSLSTHRAVASVGVYVLISMAMSMLKSPITMFTPILYTAELDGVLFTSITLWCQIIADAVFSVALYFITHHFMKKKLNLQ